MFVLRRFSFHRHVQFRSAQLRHNIIQWRSMKLRNNTTVWGSYKANVKYNFNRKIKKWTNSTVKFNCFFFLAKQLRIMSDVAYYRVIFTQSRPSLLIIFLPTTYSNQFYRFFTTVNEYFLAILESKTSLEHLIRSNFGCFFHIKSSRFIL